jgi:flagellar biosynthesis GTPase FlhF
MGQSRTQQRTGIAVALVLFLTGTVHAAPLAQVTTPLLEVPDWAVALGGGVVVLYLVSRIVTAIASSRQPSSLQDTLQDMTAVQSKAEDNRAKEIELKKQEVELEERRRKDQVERDNKRDAQTDRLIAQLEKDHTRMHDNEAAMMQNAREEVEAKRAHTAAIDGYHKLVEKLADDVRDAMKSFVERLGKVEERSSDIERRIGKDDAQASLQKLMSDITDKLNQLVQLANNPPQPPVSDTKGTPDETSTDPTHPTSAVDAPGPRADAGADGGGHA